MLVRPRIGNAALTDVRSVNRGAARLDTKRDRAYAGFVAQHRSISAVRRTDMVSFADPYRAKPYVLNGETAPAFWLVATLWLPMATGVQTGNRLGLLEQHMPTGIGPPAHCHPLDEGFYVIEGEITFIAAGQSERVRKGGFAHLPRFTEHTFVVESESARVLNFYTPAGFEMILMSVASLAKERRRPSKVEAPMPPPEQVFILSNLFGMEEVDLMPFASPPTEAVMMTKPSARSPVPVHIAATATAPLFSVFGLQWRLLASSADTAGTYNLFELTLPANAGFGPWIHAQDQAFYILEGGTKVLLDDRVVEVGAGSFVFVPAGTSNGLRAGTDGARLLLFHLPADLDRAIAQSSDADGMSGTLQAIGTRAAATPAGW